MGPDEPIINLPQSERQMINIFGQDEIDLGEQLFGRCPRSPWCESTNTRAAAFGTSKKDWFATFLTLLFLPALYALFGREQPSSAADGGPIATEVSHAGRSR